METRNLILFNIGVNSNNGKHITFSRRNVCLLVDLKPFIYDKWAGMREAMLMGPIFNPDEWCFYSFMRDAMYLNLDFYPCRPDNRPVRH